MKSGIHPKYYSTTITCVCGQSFDVGSTVEDVRVEVCSKCHPFYTGARQKMVDATGRVERFRKRYAKKS